MFLINETLYYKKGAHIKRIVCASSPLHHCFLLPIPSAACQNVSCNGGGTCYASAANLSSAVCTSCLSGRYGPLCQWPGSDPCVGGSGACSGHGVCSYGEKGIKQCSCSRDYNSSSSSCSLPTFDYCFGSNCTNGGSCDLVASIKAQTTVCACTASEYYIMWGV